MLFLRLCVRTLIVFFDDVFCVLPCPERTRACTKIMGLSRVICFSISRGPCSHSAKQQKQVRLIQQHPIKITDWCSIAWLHSPWCHDSFNFSFPLNEINCFVLHNQCSRPFLNQNFRISVFEHQVAVRPIQRCACSARAHEIKGFLLKVGGCPPRGGHGRFILHPGTRHDRRTNRTQWPQFELVDDSS